MKKLKKSKIASLVIRNAAASLLLLIADATNAVAAPRLIEGTQSPEAAARGFTGTAGCSGAPCLELNPAFLYSEDEKVRPYFSFGTRFNEALFDTVDNWEETKKVFNSNRYHDIFLNTWNLVSRQTAKVDLEAGLSIGNFSFSCSPNNFGAVFFAHDPVLPFGNLTTYAFGIVQGGYAHRLSQKIRNLKSLTLGGSIKYTKALTSQFTFNQIGNQFNETESHQGSWLTGRLGTTAVLDTERAVALSLVISGIPLAGSPLTQMPHMDFFDISPGADLELAKTWWGNIHGYYSLSRLGRNENFLLNQHIGFEGTIGKFKTSLGISDAMVTYGLTLALPLIKFSVATYGVEYSGLIHNTTDRVYWFKVEI